MTIRLFPGSRVQSKVLQLDGSRPVGTVDRTQSPGLIAACTTDDGGTFFALWKDLLPAPEVLPDV
jgi:hypothetical protein